ncbi:hypothetical protein [Caulobacter sp. 17J80-11]|uniref:hypothetical protein n=1 Tax=Caulobacter sp. 17J80-11 TaxID=2763502 RepID=UPI0016538B5C|nr:hypothetical protein [Caulobacter sp. 17J80-11]MBC6980450.1 hypothetical protein [Caulobacter sp. 17J80-11]
MSVINRAVRAATLAAFAGLTACASLPEPQMAGQAGRITGADGKAKIGTLVAVHAPQADRCQMNGQASWKKTEAGDHEFLFTAGAWSNPKVINVVCAGADGAQSTRDVQAPFFESQWRSARTSSTVAAAIVSGPLALITGPLVAEAQKDAYRFPPVLIHVPTAVQVETDAARELSLQEAADRWAKLQTELKAQCEDKKRKIPVGYVCDPLYFGELRDADLAVFRGAK